LHERFKEFNKSLVYLAYQDLNERERNLDKQILESSNNLDEKYSVS
jgi:hypothetical protein